MKNNNNLFETDEYTVSVGKSLDFDGPTPGRLLYQIINKNTSVVEREDFALPFAIETAKSLQEQLVVALEGEGAGSTTAILTH